MEHMFENPMGIIKMMLTSTYAPSHSLAIIGGFGYFEVPDFPDGEHIAATHSCIVVGCRSDMDGPTTFSLARRDEILIKDPPVFSGVIHIIRGKLAIQDIYVHSILEMGTDSEDLFVQIWTNDPKEPDHVVVGFRPT